MTRNCDNCGNAPCPYMCAIGETWEWKPRTWRYYAGWYWFVVRSVLGGYLNAVLDLAAHRAVSRPKR